LAGLVLVEQGFGRGLRSAIDDPVPNGPIPNEPINGSEIPTALGDFKILRELGRGGMGIVYEAQQLSLGRRVALKVLSFASGLDPIRLQRFRNEAQAAAQLHHTHIVPVYAVGVDRGVHFYAMQLIDGLSLAQVVESIKRSKTDDSSDEPDTTDSKRGTSTRKTAIGGETKSVKSRSGRVSHYQNVAKMVIQAASGLAHAHLYGVVHRDIKPANLMLDPLGNIWITDFGLAQVQSDFNLTRSGDMLGTLRYMSPEQSAGGAIPVDHRTDIYSLGVTFYELLTLQPAITGNGYKEIANQISEQEPRNPTSIDPQVPHELEIIMRKAIAKNPQERYETAALMAEDFQRWLDDKQILAKPPTWPQRLAKWRRRHASLVAAMAVFSTIAGIGLSITTVIILREQFNTSQALAKEHQQRIAAEVSFQQARRAVETFSNLGEMELANRPDLKSLRKEFLEASVNFYQDFIDLRRDEPSLRNELSATKQRVERLVDTLTRLDRMEPLRLLSYASIQKELGLAESDSKEILEFIERTESASDDSQAAEQLDQAESISMRLNASQWKRLREINRQLRLPFSFKSVETAQLLELTQSQRREIVLIIEQERPDKIANQKDKMEKGGPGRPPRDGERGPPGFQPELPPEEDRFRGAPKGPPSHRRGPLFGQTLFSSQTAKTVDRIIAILTPKQQAVWQDLVGRAFEFPDF
jgi:serine/threonine protein kinase